MWDRWKVGGSGDTFKNFIEPYLLNGCPAPFLTSTNKFCSSLYWKGMKNDETAPIFMAIHESVSALVPDHLQEGQSIEPSHIAPWNRQWSEP